jgi:hypothetical protein
MSDLAEAEAEARRIIDNEPPWEVTDPDAMNLDALIKALGAPHVLILIGIGMTTALKLATEGLNAATRNPRKRKGRK